jgi:hypothetical protein
MKSLRIAYFLSLEECSATGESFSRAFRQGGATALPDVLSNAIEQIPEDEPQTGAPGEVSPGALVFQ